MFKQKLTVAEASPATANAKRIATLSWCLAFLGSQIPHTNHTKVAVARNSIQNACGIETSSNGFVTQNEEPFILRMATGVTVTNNP